MKKRTRNVLIAVAAAIGLPICLSAVYLIANLQGVIEPFEVNSPDCAARVLVASQGSAYKNAVLARLVERVRGADVHLKVVDATALGAEDPQAWDAVVLIASVQAGSLPGAAREFLGKVKRPERIVPLVTSGSGEHAAEAKALDAITSASRIDPGKVDEESAQVLARLEKAIGVQR